MDQSGLKRFTYHAVPLLQMYHYKLRMLSRIYLFLEQNNNYVIFTKNGGVAHV